MVSPGSTCGQEAALWVKPQRPTFSLAAPFLALSRLRRAGATAAAFRFRVASSVLRAVVMPECIFTKKWVL